MIERMADRLPPMQALRAFEAAARTRSLSRAAESLHLTHGAISHQIKSLEADLGVRLVERAGRGIRLTDEGERFASRVRAILSDLTDAVREASEHSNPRQLRVSVMPSFAARWLLPRIGRFFAAHPEIDVDVSASNAIADFKRDDVDVGVRHGLGPWPGVNVEFLLDDVYFPVCSPRLSNGKLPAHPAELARYTLLRSEGDLWKPWFEVAGLDWPEPSRGPMFSDSAHTMQAAIEGQGIALGRTSLLGNDLRNGVLVRLFDIDVPSPRKYFLVYPPRLADSPKLVAFRKWLFDEVAAEEHGSSAARATSSPRRTLASKVRVSKHGKRRAGRSPARQGG
jgi:LysR family transcriptional regulator, glycine cleavage system transcriptional activator